MTDEQFERLLKAIKNIDGGPSVVAMMFAVCLGVLLASCFGAFK